ncbi:MAG TPA: DoxX family membrane protein [Chitinophagales bacterium]|nr:DoxX family membrane protein [Chitinophagales bacterium]
MSPVFQNIHSAITDRTTLYFRGILFLTFLGHGLVSLGFSPGYELHYRIFESVNYFHLNPGAFLRVLGFWDIFLAVSIVSGLAPRVFLSAAIIYLCSVAVAGYLFFYHKTGSLFGIAESFRRFAWIFYAIFLWIYFFFSEKRYSLLRVGIGFAFLAHGLASLGFFGLKGGHIELASQLFSEETANKIIYYSGFSDTVLGLLMVSGILSRPAAIIGSFWLVVVVYLSALLAFPDAIFRSGFLLSCVYVALDKRCHTLLWRRGVVQ